MHKYLNHVTPTMVVKSKIENKYGSTIASKNQILDILAVIKEEKWNAPAELSGDNGFICLEGMQGALKFDIHGMLEFIKMSLNASDIEIRDSAIDAARLLTERDNSGGEAENFPDKQYMVHLLKSYSNELLSANEYDAFGNGLVLSSFFGFENIAPQYELNISKHIADPDAKIKFSAYKYLFSHQNSLFYKKALDELPSESNEIKYLFIESFSSNANSNKDEILQC